MELLCSSPLKLAPRTKRLFRHKAESRLQAQESSLQQSHVKEPLPDFDRLPELLVLHPIAAERESEGAVACRNQSAGHGCYNEVFSYTMNPYTVYGWLSKLGSLFGSLLLYGTYYLGYPTRDPNFDNHPYEP